MYELYFEYDTEDGLNFGMAVQYEGTWEEMMAFVGRHGLIKVLNLTLI